MTRDTDQLDRLYQDVILDHYRSPRNVEPLEQFDAEAHIDNPFCGDEVDIQLRLGDGRVEAVSISGRGCSISQSSASLMGETIKGMTPAEARELAGIFTGLLEGAGPPEDDLAKIGDLVALEGVRQFPVRIKCALLAWAGLDDALRQLDKDSGTVA